MHGWKYVEQESLIDPNTMMFLYTDGLTEAENTAHQQFEESRIIATASQAKSEGIDTPKELITHMSKAVREFVGEAEQSDDLTMLAILYSHQQQNTRFQRSITLPNNIEEIPQLADFVEEICELVGYDPATTMSMNLALEEAVVNVMNYAYPSGAQGEVNIEAMADNNYLTFIIRDRGIPFDPTVKKDVDTTLSAEERPIGGLGIYLVRQLMDSINYEREHGKNVLTLRKKIT